jgi:hypothetical protein
LQLGNRSSDRQTSPIGIAASDQLIGALCGHKLGVFPVLSD